MDHEELCITSSIYREGWYTISEDMKRVTRFLRQYSLFSLALATLIIALILQFTDHEIIAHWVLAIVSIIELLPLLWKMWQDFRSCTYGFDLQTTTTNLTSVILGQY